MPPGYQLVRIERGFLRLCGPFYMHERLPVVAVRVTEQHLNMQDIAHGGFLAALADSAYGIVMRRDLPGIVPRTAHLSVDYLSAVRAGDWLEAHVEVVKHGRRITNGICRLAVGDRIVLQTMGVFATMPNTEPLRQVIGLAS
ncbi:MAG: PaaI family thioesterase [Cupriavidus necator]